MQKLKKNLKKRRIAENIWKSCNNKNQRKCKTEKKKKEGGKKQGEEQYWRVNNIEKTIQGK